ncbi:MAG: OmpA family protein [Saprospiraceae bacterium]
MQPFVTQRSSRFSKFSVSTFLLFICCFLALPASHAQLGDRLKRAAQRGAERALERNAQKKTEEAVDKVFEKKERREDSTSPDGEEIGLEEDASVNGNSTSAPSERVSSSSSSPSEVETTSKPAFSMSSKFDFEPGAAIIHYDDFSRSSLGDLPTGYNTLGSAELMKLNTSEGKYLKINDGTGQIVAYDFTEFPENFTFEFDIAHDIPFEGYRYKAELGIMFTDEADPEKALTSSTRKVGKNNVTFWIDRDISRGWASGFEKTKDGEWIKGKSGKISDHFNEASRGKPQHISIWRQGKRFRMYINEDKVYDVPLAWTGSGKIAGLRFIGQMNVEGDSYLVSNLRLAKGAPDTRSKLETEGKLTTYGITFASGSSTVEPTSAGTLKRIAQTLDGNPDMRIRITGHTDGDGDAPSNQTLSEQRAQAVKSILSSSYGIASDRLEAGGQGESMPIAANDDPLGKAMNRRVVLEVI